MPLINQAPKTLSFHENTPWVKKEGKEDFDVLMGCFEGAEACERVNTYILNQIKDNFEGHSLGVYRDDHPPTSIRELPKSIEKRLSELSCNKQILEKAIPPYNDAFKKSGFKENLAYKPKTTTSNILDKKQGKRNIICFNPPCSANVKTNIGRIFLSVLKRKIFRKEQVTKEQLHEQYIINYQLDLRINYSTS